MNIETIDTASLVNVTGAGALARTGHAIGFGAGVAVTAGLSVVPGWNSQVPGQPAGFQRRHESVVGPQIAGYAARQPAGAWKDFTSGVGAGATEAPRWSFEHGV
jgi:hypothetical protein